MSDNIQRLQSHTAQAKAEANKCKTLAKEKLKEATGAVVSNIVKI